MATGGENSPTLWNPEIACACFSRSLNGRTRSNICWSPLRRIITILHVCQAWQRQNEENGKVGGPLLHEHRAETVFSVKIVQMTKGTCADDRCKRAVPWQHMSDRQIAASRCPNCKYTTHSTTPSANYCMVVGRPISYNERVYVMQLTRPKCKRSTAITKW